jgi:hypothetical protein
MRKPNIFYRLRVVASFAVLGAVTANVFFGWIDRSIDMQTIGAVIGAGAASIKEFHLV